MTRVNKRYRKRYILLRLIRKSEDMVTLYNAGIIDYNG